MLVWGGLRGTIALALVLSVPATVSGRPTLQVLTFGVVLMSLAGQGLTMPSLTGRLGLAGEAPPRAARREALLDGFVAPTRSSTGSRRPEPSGAWSSGIWSGSSRGGECAPRGAAAAVGRAGRGDEDRLFERMAPLVAQRRRIDALRRGRAVSAAAADELTDEIDRRHRRPGERLGRSASGGAESS